MLQIKAKKDIHFNLFEKKKYVLYGQVEISDRPPDTFLKSYRLTQQTYVILLLQIYWENKRDLLSLAAIASHAYANVTNP